LTAIVESLQNLPPNTGKAAAGRIPDPMTFGRSNSQRECGKRMLLRLRPLASRFYTNKLKGVVHVHPPEPRDVPSFWKPSESRS